MISIIIVKRNADDFLNLLLESINRFSEMENDIFVIDNSEHHKPIDGKNVKYFPMPLNIGHGKGLNYGVSKVVELTPKNPFVMFLDVDCHLLCHKWESKFLSKMKDHVLIGARGVPEKPIRPACMFMHYKIAKNNDWADTPNYQGHRKTPSGYDVGIKAYYKLLADNFSIGFLEKGPNRYGTNHGEEWLIGNMPIVYHHWHGSHLDERQKEMPDVDLNEDKNKLFRQIAWRLP